VKRTTNNTSGADKPLTLQEESFVGFYLSNGGNGGAAVRSAGFKCKAKGAADVQSSRLLRRAKVAEEIAKRRAVLRKSADVTAQEVIQTLAAQMRSDITELFSAKGSFDLAQVRAAGLGKLIKKVALERVPPKPATNRRKAQPERIYVSRLELYSAQSAANQLCKVLGINQQPGANKNDPEYLRTLLDERVAFALEGFTRLGKSLGTDKKLIRRDVLEMMAKTPETAGDLLPLIQAELASEAIQ
jgi:phage terminase small subunit